MKKTTKIWTFIGTGLITSCCFAQQLDRLQIQQLYNDCLTAPSMSSPACVIIIRKNLYDYAYIENQRRLIKLKEQQFEYQKQRDKQKDDEQKQALRQQRITEMHKSCLDNSDKIKNSSQQVLCNAIENHLNYGMPISDSQLGVP